MTPSTIHPTNEPSFSRPRSESTPPTFIYPWPENPPTTNLFPSTNRSENHLITNTPPTTNFRETPPALPSPVIPWPNPSESALPRHLAPFSQSFPFTPTQHSLPPSILHPQISTLPPQQPRPLLRHQNPTTTTALLHSLASYESENSILRTHIAQFRTFETTPATRIDAAAAAVVQNLERRLNAAEFEIGRLQALLEARGMEGRGREEWLVGRVRALEAQIGGGRVRGRRVGIGGLGVHEAAGAGDGDGGFIRTTDDDVDEAMRRQSEEPDVMSASVLEPDHDSRTIIVRLPPPSH